MNKEEKIRILNENIYAIENQKYMSEFVGGGYGYSENLTSIFDILNDEEYRDIYNENMGKYDKRNLEQNIDPDEYTMIECIVYFNWVWHVDGSGMATGLIKRRIEQGIYLKALKRFRKLLDK